MKTQTQDTSKEALRSLNKIDGRRLQVYNCIKKLGECSNSMISKELRLLPNQVTGRVNELRNMFKVVGYAKKDLCPVTNRMVLFWKVVKDFDKFEDNESNLNLNKSVCYKCGLSYCDCEVLK